MWFKNLTLFRFTEPFALTAVEIAQHLETMRFRPCGGHDESSFGWTSPLGRHSEELVHSCNGYIMVCGKKEEKVLPASVINELLHEKISDLETEQARKLSKKERTEIKDELIFELLPRAFSFSRNTYAYIDPKGGWVIVDSGSTSKAEDVLSSLRKCLGSLPVVPVNTLQKPIHVMTEWLTTHETPQDIRIENECELRSPDDTGGIIRCKKHDLGLPEIKHHLETGKQVTQLALNWENRLSFVLTDNYAIKRLRFLDLIQEQVTNTQADTEIEHFDVDFSIMTAEFATFLPRVLEILGGENKL
jgi:recombination associated protein RdgC